MIRQENKAKPNNGVNEWGQLGDCPGVSDRLFGIQGLCIRRIIWRVRFPLGSRLVECSDSWRTRGLANDDRMRDVVGILISCHPSIHITCSLECTRKSNTREIASHAAPADSVRPPSRTTSYVCVVYRELRVVRTALLVKIVIIAFNTCPIP